MALVLANRVRETTTTTGTGTVTLAGAVTGYQSFSAIGNANTTYYTISGQGTSEWEVGIGTYTSSGTTLSRDTVLASSNSGSLVSFSAGTKDVFVTYPSNKAIYSDASSNVTLPGALIGPASASVFNTVSTTVNAFGAATTLNIGNSGGTNTILGVSNFSQGMNGALGQTTPAALAATTGAFSDTITSTKTSGAFLNAQSATTGLIYINIANTSGSAVIGVENSTATTWTGSTAYATLIGTSLNKPVQIGSNGVIVGSFSSTGLAVTGTGSVTTGFAVGGATPQTGGVAFPATAVAVADVNTLDDYEEGTWTPSLGGNATYNSQTGTYTKIGRLVYVYCDLAVNVLGTGGQTISGLPFAAAGGSEPSTCLWNSLAISSVYLAFYSNGTSVYHQNATAAAASLTDGASIFTNSTAVKFCLVYNV